jgi:phosphomannomutase
MAEYDWPFLPEERARLTRLLMEEKALPEFREEILNVSYLDGVKLQFRDGWLIIRFSGTEPRLRVFCEMPNRLQAEKMCLCAAQFLGLKI